MPQALHSANKPSNILTMRQMDIETFADLDLKTLRVLAALLDTASVTRTAEIMGMSQPAASRAVGRLRAAIGDPLLVRTRKGYVLTARAEALRPVIEAALESVARVFEGEIFNPASARHKFKLATTDYGAVAVASPLMTRLAKSAPHTMLDVTGWTDDTLDRLENGRCDVALFADAALPPDFHFRELFVESYVLVLRHKHPALEGFNGRPSRVKGILSQLSQFPRAAMMFPEGRQLSADDVLDRLGVATRATAFRTPYFMSAPWIIAETDVVIVVPSRVGQRMASIAGLAIVPLAAPDENFSYRMIWHERVHRDPAQIWLRAQMLEACQRTLSSTGNISGNI